MENFLLQISGLVAVIIAWVFVVTPAICSGIDPKRQTITNATKKSKRVSFIISFGLVFSAIFQSIFALYLIDRFDLSFSNIGILVYLSTNIATMFLAFFHIERHPKLHIFFAIYYFIVSPISYGLIGSSISGSSNHLFELSILMILLYGFGELVLLYKYRGGALAEIWPILLLSIWTMVFTIA
ncbi:hypothetical protein H6763_00290 [Candidatus Nomurabacteria bacterium]|uniref:Uncharacterized protein n=1 Tax=Candidatus Dojkabacteria bacterium TaxID=2099670 RepID=A0A955KWZ6_9BACT|nr:hypothetical protein [Candidatus Dojkabacteria bacterium]MCB9790225.1 hypothetical protein [Candidatus Nomurabacteria bacterium]MCB9803254.1 hypothetical protein [Candidatus Nomurabacteria bacterium]